MKKTEPITKQQAKVLLRAAMQLSKITGQHAETTLVAMIKQIAGHIRSIRNKVTF